MTLLRPSATQSALGVILLLSLSTGCRQKMADQPYYRPYEPSDFFADGRSNRPLERGVIHRAQHLESDPIATGLSTAEWTAFYEFSAKAADAPQPQVDAKLTPEQIDDAAKKIAFGAPRYDPRVAGSPKVYADEFPFPLTKDDLKRGQERYTIYCAVCHGALGNGQGKIWERGYLTPTSFHTQKVDAHEVDMSDKKPPLGFSRGYALWGIEIPLRDAPVGYYFEVITRGFGGMPSYSAQIPPADRWRIIAYVRVLQMSQIAGNLPPEVKAKIDAGGKP